LLFIRRHGSDQSFCCSCYVSRAKWIGAIVQVRTLLNPAKNWEKAQE
jgi:hypothetical protein